MHRDQAIRDACVAALAGLAADVRAEQATRVARTARPLVVVMARDATIVESDGTMGDHGAGPADRRALLVEHDIYTEGKTGLAVVNAIKDLEVAIGAAYAAENVPGGTIDPLVVDLRWWSSAIELASEQEKFIGVATVVYRALFDVYYGDPT